MPERRLLGLVLALALLVPTSGAHAGETVRIFAASSLTDALSDATTLFERTHPGIRVVAQYGSSSDLARQILAGAPADLYFSADERQMKRLESAGLVVGVPQEVLSNQLVIVRHRDSEKRIESPRDLLGVERIAMADPEVVPAGVYARLYLEQLGLWSALREKVVPTLDVRAALAAVSSGNVELGFVYRTDAAIDKRVGITYPVPREEGPRIVYPLALLGETASVEARKLFDFLVTGDARALFERWGFVPLGEER